MGIIVDLLKEIPLSAVLREKLQNVERELESLRERNANLEAALAAKSAKVAELERKLLPPSKPKLEEFAAKLLFLVMEQPDQTAMALGNALKANPELIEYHLQELKAQKYVADSHTMGSSWTGESGRTEWSIAQAGRSYLVANGLLT